MARDRDEVLEVARWAKGIEGVHGCIAGRFHGWEPRRRALDYLKGLLSPVERKNGWQLAEQAGDATPDGVQRLLSTITGKPVWLARTSGTRWWSIWVTPLGCWWWTRPGSLKKGSKSVGVQRQYSGTAGRIENCQVGYS